MKITGPTRVTYENDFLTEMHRYTIEITSYEIADANVPFMVGLSQYNYDEVGWRSVRELFTRNPAREGEPISTSLLRLAALALAIEEHEAEMYPTRPGAG